jgi:uncharacterized protein YejL (UPF0352 family)
VARFLFRAAVAGTQRRRRARAFSSSLRAARAPMT